MRGINLDDETISTLKAARVQEEFYDSSFVFGGSFGIRVSKSGRKSFFVVYPVAGRRKRITLGTFPVISYENAKASAMNIMAQASEGRDPKALYEMGLSIRTFSELITRFLDEYVQNSCNPKTSVEYKRIIQKELLPLWKNMPPSAITSRDITSLIRNIEIERKAPTMAMRTRAVISRVFSFAVARGYLSKNPVEQILVDYTPQTRQRILEPTSISALWACLVDERTNISAIFKILMLTGQRVSDVLSMKWSDITFTTWKLSQSHSGLGLVYLSPPAVQVLEVLQSETEVNRSQFVFPADGDPTKHFANLGKATQRISKRMGISPSWSPADLRSTVEANLLSLGIHPRIVNQVLNRTSSSRALSGGKKVTYDDVKGALTLWGQKVVELTSPSRRPPANDKVVKLFG